MRSRELANKILPILTTTIVLGTLIKLGAPIVKFSGVLDFQKKRESRGLRHGGVTPDPIINPYLTKSPLVLRLDHPLPMLPETRSS